jgi:serine O-acetyltransferase
MMTEDLEKLEALDERKRRLEDMEQIVEALCAPIENPLYHRGQRFRNMLLPSRHIVIECSDELRAVMFPGYFGYREFRDDTLRFHIGATLDKVMFRLQEEVRHACRYVEGHDYGRHYAGVDQVEQIMADFLQVLPSVRHRLLLDAQACYEWDPAVFIPEAPIFCYPNMLALINYRIAHELYLRDVPFIPRIMTEHAHTLTGIDIHPGARIGESCFIDHGSGVVIGQTAELGDRVRLYQGVTLGALRFPLDDATQRPQKGIPRHPVVEDDVVIYAEATVLGRITIGRGSVIGANVFLTRSLPPYSKVFEPPARSSQISTPESAQEPEGAAGG